MGLASYIVYSSDIGMETERDDVIMCRGYDFFKENRRNAKIYKILPHLFFPDVDYHIWVDSNVTLNVEPMELIEKMDKDVAVFAHWERDCIYEEAIACQTRDDPRIIKEQMERYRKEGYPEHAGLGMCFLIIRKNTKTVATLNNAWWAEICAGSVRDQLSFPYIYRDEVQYFDKVNYLQPNEYFTRT